MVATINDYNVFFIKNPIKVSINPIGNPIKIPKEANKINFTTMI